MEIYWGPAGTVHKQWPLCLHPPSGFQEKRENGFVLFQEGSDDIGFPNVWAGKKKDIFSFLSRKINGKAPDPNTIIRGGGAAINTHQNRSNWRYLPPSSKLAAEEITCPPRLGKKGYVLGTARWVWYSPMVLKNRTEGGVICESSVLKLFINFWWYMCCKWVWLNLFPWRDLMHAAKCLLSWREPFIRSRLWLSSFNGKGVRIDRVRKTPNSPNSKVSYNTDYKIGHFHRGLMV